MSFTILHRWKLKLLRENNLNMLDIWIEWPVSADQAPNFVLQFGDELTLIALVRAIQVVFETEHPGSIAVITVLSRGATRLTRMA